MVCWSRCFVSKSEIEYVLDLDRDKISIMDALLEPQLIRVDMSDFSESPPENDCFRGGRVGGQTYFQIHPEIRHEAAHSKSIGGGGICGIQFCLATAKCND